jgi:hypothetical protein
MFRPKEVVVEAEPVAAAVEKQAEPVAAVVEKQAEPVDEEQEGRAVADLVVECGVAHQVARERLEAVLVSLHQARIKRAGEMRTPGSRIRSTKSVPPARKPQRIPIEMQLPGPIPIAMI